MQFNSVDFLIFLPLVLLIYNLIPKRMRYIWLLISSYFFYMCWNAKYALLILTSTVITYFSGVLIEKIRDSEREATSKKKLCSLVVAGSFIGNLSILAYFKYTNFLLQTITKLLSVIHINLNIPVFDILLPVGISFYTFQALSYTMDIYRGEINAEKNFLKYALFVSFFPQLVAGPIERSKNLLSQLHNLERSTWDELREGFLLFLWGLFLKIVVADRISIFVNIVYADIEKYPGMYLLVATILFAFQIYCDFYGYSTMAQGSAKMLGINLMDNFNGPYLAPTVQEFWRRWHISLTSWFKDYLYFPLGGSRKGKVRKYINKMIVFAVSGLWHGPSISFIIWGALNGLYQVIGEALMPFRKKVSSFLKIDRESAGFKIAGCLVTFVLVDFSWIFFRANGTKEAFLVIKSILTTKNYWVLFDKSLTTFCLDYTNFYLMVFTIALVLFVDYLNLHGIKVREMVLKQGCWFRYLFIALSVVAILTFGKYGPRFDAAKFIYFQF